MEPDRSFHCNLLTTLSRLRGPCIRTLRWTSRSMEWTHDKSRSIVWSIYCSDPSSSVQASCVPHLKLQPLSSLVNWYSLFLFGRRTMQGQYQLGIRTKNLSTNHFHLGSMYQRVRAVKTWNRYTWIHNRLQKIPSGRKSIWVIEEVSCLAAFQECHWKVWA